METYVHIGTGETAEQLAERIQKMLRHRTNWTYMERPYMSELFRRDNFIDRLAGAIIQRGKQAPSDSSGQVPQTLV